MYEYSLNLYEDQPEIYNLIGNFHNYDCINNYILAIPFHKLCY